MLLTGIQVVFPLAAEPTARREVVSDPTFCRIVFYGFSSTSCGAIQPAFDFSVVPSSLTIDLCLPSDTCPVPDPFTAVEPTAVSYHVKGLAVPRGPRGRQNNPFSNWSPPLPDLTTVCE